jgi:hypothetical protein
MDRERQRRYNRQSEDRALETLADCFGARAGMNGEQRHRWRGYVQGISQM